MAKDALVNFKQFNEGTLLNLIDKARDLIYIISNDGILRYVNHAVADILGYTPEEVIDTNFIEYIPVDSRDRLTEVFQKFSIGEISEYYEESRVISKKDGGFTWLGQSIYSIVSDGELLIFGICRNIDKQKKLEALQLLNEQKQGIINYFATSLLGSNTIDEILWDITYNCVSMMGFEDCVIYLFNHDKTKLIQQAAYGSGKEKDFKILNAITIPVGKGIVGTVAQTGRAEIIDDLEADSRYIVDDMVRQSEITIPIIYENEVIGVIDSKHSEKAFFTPFHLDLLQIIASLASNKLMRAISLKTKAENEEKYKGIIENMQLGLIELNAEGIIEKVYPGFCKLVGYSEEELIGKKPELLLQGFVKSHPPFQDQTKIREAKFQKKDGSVVWVLVSEAPTYDYNHNKIGTIRLYYDVSEQIKMQEELRIAQERSEKARIAEKEFIANMSHEIRNPITSILGMTNLMYDTPLNVQQLEYINNIDFSSNLLLSLVNEILDVNKIDSGKMVMDFSDFNPELLLKRLAKTTHFRKRKKQVELKLDLDPMVPGKVRGSEKFINQILLNLLSNAEKFTNEGTITLSMTFEKIQDKKIYIQFMVRDTGIGISQDRLNQVFERFNQAGKVTNSEFAGSGLGLFITKQLTELHGGTITVESNLGTGTTFTVTIPFEVARGGSKAFMDSESDIPLEITKSNARLLIVEDNSINRSYLEKLLEKYNVGYNSAANGLEAIALLQKEKFDLILMDIRMPEMDGYETTRHLRNLKSNTNRMIPIIALTASAQLDVKEKALAAGMNHHIAKPFKEDELIKAINQHLYIPSGKHENRQECLPNSFQFSHLLNQDGLDGLYSGNPEQIKSMFQIFLEVMPADIANLKTAIFHNDGSLIRELLHKIKPNFRLVGLDKLEQRVISLEKKLSLNPVEEMILDLDQFILKVNEGIEVISAEMKYL